MKTNFSMLFYLKKQKNYTSGLAPVYLRITVDGERSEVTTNRECEPEKWNSDSRCATGVKENIKSLNTFLDNLQSDAYEANRYLHEGWQPLQPKLFIWPAPINQILAPGNSNGSIFIKIAGFFC